MAEPLERTAIADLYEDDFYAWTQAQAQTLRRRAHNAIDWDNLAEEIESVGRSDKREIRSRLTVLLHHLLKWEFQPERRCHSWQSSIGEQRTFVAGIVEDSPSLRAFPREVLASSYERARRGAAEETGLSPSVFPLDCPWPIDRILAYDFMPGRPWSPDDLLLD